MEPKLTVPNNSQLICSKFKKKNGINAKVYQSNYCKRYVLAIEQLV